MKPNCSAESPGDATAELDTRSYLDRPPTLQSMLTLSFMTLLWWWDRGDKNSSTVDPKRLARWLGISHRIGSDLCYWLITESGQIISKSSIQHVIKDNFINPDIKVTIENFNKRLVKRLDDSSHHVELPEAAEKYRLPDVPLPNDLEHDERDENKTPKDDGYDDMLVDERPDDDEEEMIDKYLGMELIMDVGTNNERGARVVKRARTDDGKAIGSAHSNPILDTHTYEIEFADGTRDKITANIIAENVYA